MQIHLATSESNDGKMFKDNIPLDSGEVVIGKDRYSYKATLIINQEKDSTRKASYKFEIFASGNEDPVADVKLYLDLPLFPPDENILKRKRRNNESELGRCHYIVNGHISYDFGAVIDPWIPSYLFNFRMNLVPKFITLLTERSLIEPGRLILSQVIASSKNTQSKRGKEKEPGKWTTLMMERYNRSHPESPYKKESFGEFLHYFRSFSS